MALPDTLATDPLDDLGFVGELSDTLGNAIKVNAERSAGISDSGQAKDYAQAALYATQALAALIPYQDPSAGNPPGDNPAKKGD